jgi:EAL domain-containing protein (putative c-di-GMP-specific phosphodiesterase class I)
VFDEHCESFHNPGATRAQRRRREHLLARQPGPSIGDARVLSMIRRAIADGLDPANVIFEVTETAAVSSFERAEQFARDLKAVGCKLALDDFGTGFGSSPISSACERAT